MRLLLPLLLIVSFAGPAIGQSMPGGYPAPNSLWLGGSSQPLCSCGGTGTFSLDSNTQKASGWYVTPYNGCTVGAPCPYTLAPTKGYSDFISAPAGYCLKTVDCYVNSSTDTPVPTCQSFYSGTECPGVSTIYYTGPMYWVYPPSYRCP